MAVPLFVKVPHAIKSDATFAPIYGDNAVLGAWVKLLIAADSAHPSPAELPRSVTDDQLEVIVQAGLLEVLPGGLYLIPSLTEDREARTEKARQNGKGRGRATAEEAVAEQPLSNGSAVAQPPLSNGSAMQMQMQKQKQKQMQKQMHHPHERETLSKAQHDSWRTYTAPYWSPVKEALNKRGFLFAPRGEQDQEGSQRQLLHALIDQDMDTASRIAAWIGEYDGPRDLYVLIGYLKDKDAAIKASIPPDRDRVREAGPRSSLTHVSDYTSLEAMGLTKPDFYTKREPKPDPEEEAA